MTSSQQRWSSVAETGLARAEFPTTNPPIMLQLSLWGAKLVNALAEIPPASFPRGVRLVTLVLPPMGQIWQHLLFLYGLQSKDWGHILMIVYHLVTNENYIVTLSVSISQCCTGTQSYSFICVSSTPMIQWQRWAVAAETKWLISHTAFIVALYTTHLTNCWYPQLCL